jgi:putative hydrolase of the HAD superfamily
MEIQAVAFDVNGTLIEILTEDGSEQVFRGAGHYLTYQGIDLRRHHLRDIYFQFMKDQQQASAEAHPEFDAVAIWARVIAEHATDFTRALPSEQLAQMPLFLAEMTRGLARRRLRLYPHVREVLDLLHGRLPLALVTDAQSSYARGELHKVGITHYFDPIVVSGDHGYRKPDRRLFDMAVERMGVPAQNTLYVGNDMHRDVHGAREAGLQTAMFDSDQGAKEHLGTVPDYRISSHRELLSIVGLGFH